MGFALESTMLDLGNPSIQIIPTLDTKVCKTVNLTLHVAIEIPMVRQLPACWDGALEDNLAKSYED